MPPHQSRLVIVVMISSKTTATQMIDRQRFVAAFRFGFPASSS